MDIGDEIMVHLFMQEEANATAEQEHHLLMLTNLLHLRHHVPVVPLRGGSWVGMVLRTDIVKPAHYCLTSTTSSITQHICQRIFGADLG
jgi:hypothetical protein